METYEQSSVSVFNGSRSAAVVVLFLLILFWAIIVGASRTAQAQELNVLATFTQSGSAGWSPASGLVMDRGGRLYGTNNSGRRGQTIYARAFSASPCLNEGHLFETFALSHSFGDFE
jgi:hypothetical protein